MSIIELNKFSKLHNGKTIFFCKTDFLEDDFNIIKNLDNDVILITGNSDYEINEDRSKNLPKNVKKWYGQNALIYHDRIEPIPIGIENGFESERLGHGVSYYERVTEKRNLLERNIDKVPTKKIYANFQIFTNYHHRFPVMEICKHSNHIDWEEPNLKLSDFFDKILDYEMVVCPAGNGVDTHRLWEVLYSKRIPITIKMGNFKIYELYEKLPIIVLDSIDDLNNYELIIQKYNNIKSSTFTLDSLDVNFWINNIINDVKSI
jgi:hypothetical protein